jgi:hypothetical protein
MIVFLSPIGGRLLFRGPSMTGAMTSTASPAMQKADLNAVSPDVHVVADNGYHGAGPTARVPQRRRRLDLDTGRYRRLSQNQKDVNTAPAPSGPPRSSTASRGSDPGQLSQVERAHLPECPKGGPFEQVFVGVRRLAFSARSRR